MNTSPASKSAPKSTPKSSEAAVSKKVLSLDVLKYVFGRLLEYAKPQCKYFVFSAIGMGMYAAGQVGVVAMVKVLVDQEFLSQDIQDSVLLVSFGILGVFVLRALGAFVSFFFLGIASNKLTQDIRHDTFKQLLYMPLSYYDRHPTGEILSKLTYNIDRIAQGTSDVMIAIVRDVFTFVALMAWIFYLNWFLTLILATLGIPIFIMMRYATRRFQKIHKKIQNVYGNVTNNIQKAIENNAAIKIANAQQYALDQFEKDNEAIYRQRRRVATMRASNSPLVMLLASLGLIVAVNLMTLDVALLSISTGAFVSMVTALIMLNRPLGNLTRLNASLQESVVACESVFRLLENPVEPDNTFVFKQRIRGAIEFDHVSFRYAGTTEDALSDLAFNIKQGEAVAIVGASGAGKTTLVNLVPRLYDPSAGVIRIDQQDISEVNLHSLRDQIAYAGQFSMSVHDTITKSICYGQKASLEEIRAVAQKVRLLDFIESLPEGFDTVASSNTLSSGQIQRIILARTLLQDMPILIFDEITSALDHTTEKLIYQALEKTIKGRTTLIISHRFTMVKLVERILVLKHGQIVEQGSHDELLSRQGEYHSLYMNRY